MAEKVEVKADTLPDLDDLLQCPVCYEIPSGQIFQCNEGHHVCGRCKIRLDVCPVCRALFFGTRNYAMEELIANVRKLQAFKLGGKVTTMSNCIESSTSADGSSTGEPDNNANNNDNNVEDETRSTLRPPPACKGLFRCLCCKNGNGDRLPAGRLLNHLRYFHSPELIEGHSENGEYVQAWQFNTVPGRIVTAVRVADMGIFFLVIEIINDSLCAWLSMAASPWIAHEFSYTVTISGNDREAIFSDCVWSVRLCEGSLKKRGHCLVVNGPDARALIAPVTINSKLTVRRTPPDQLTNQTQPRALLRVANRGNNRDSSHPPVAQELEPFLQDLQSDVERLSRAFATLGREANALVRSEAEMRARIESRTSQPTSTDDRTTPPPAVAQPSISNGTENNERTHLSRNARRRMRQRLRAALNVTPSPPERAAENRQRNVQPNAAPQRQNASSDTVHIMTGLAIVQHAPPAVPQPTVPNQRVNRQPVATSQRQNGHIPNNSVQNHTAVVQRSSAPTSSVSAFQQPHAPVQPTNRQLAANTQRQNYNVSNSSVPNHTIGLAVVQQPPAPSTMSRANRHSASTLQRPNDIVANDFIEYHRVGVAIEQPSDLSQPSSSPSNTQSSSGNRVRANKKRRQRR